MERQQVSRLVIGLGFRQDASAASIGEVFAAAVARAGSEASMIAVPDDKFDHPGLLATARNTKLPIERVTAEAMHCSNALLATHSPQSEKHRGVGSVCEAAALAAAGAGSRLVVSRLISADRTATAAAALDEETP
jgi:cobalt-precorrin 5A hydrolase